MSPCRPVARIFAGGGGGGGVVRMSASGAKYRAPQARARRGLWGCSPPKKIEKMGHLKPHLVRFEDSLLGNKPHKGEGSKDNNSGTFLN